MKKSSKRFKKHYIFTDQKMTPGRNVVSDNGKIIQSKEDAQIMKISSKWEETKIVMVSSNIASPESGKDVIFVCGSSVKEFVKNSSMSKIKKWEDGILYCPKVSVDSKFMKLRENISVIASDSFKLFELGMELGLFQKLTNLLIIVDNQDKMTTLKKIEQLDKEKNIRKRYQTISVCVI